MNISTVAPSNPNPLPDSSMNEAYNMLSIFLTRNNDGVNQIVHDLATGVWLGITHYIPIIPDSIADAFHSCFIPNLEFNVQSAFAKRIKNMLIEAKLDVTNKDLIDAIFDETVRPQSRRLFQEIQKIWTKNANEIVNALTIEASDKLTPRILEECLGKQLNEYME